METFLNKLEQYNPDDATREFCRKYIYYLVVYNIFILILFIYSFYSYSLSPYGWLLFTNMYSCVFPICAFIRKSYIPSLLRFYNWMLIVTSIFSIYIIFEGLFIYDSKDFTFTIIYSVLTWINMGLCWKATQNIFDGEKEQDTLLDKLNPGFSDSKKNNNKKWKIKKKFFGKGKTTKGNEESDEDV
ncbi:conserved Plasmodium protein, unknown function [Plasmodium vinckei]|uniref:DUF7641 domain-containing protein n=1 Tax=Plasmodium vinckei TaxID=5860 RepID=A0A6V7TG79_PLAVN|nr:conserved Plasmodium protein, unknown function [Plasmodium vinckei]